MKTNGLVLRKVLAVPVRFAIVAIGSILVYHHAVTDEQAQGWVTEENIETLVGIVMAMAPVAWAMLLKVRGLREVVAAILSPRDATYAEVKVRAQAPDIKAADLQMNAPPKAV